MSLTVLLPGSVCSEGNDNGRCEQEIAIDGGGEGGVVGGWGGQLKTKVLLPAGLNAV